MQKAFLSELIKKPYPYLNVWVYLYCNADNKGEFSIPSPYLLSMFKISRSTLQRILDFGCEWQGSGKEVAREWQGNVLKIKWLEQVAEKEVAREWQEVEMEKEPKQATQRKQKAKKESDKLYPIIVEAYHQFCISKTGVGAKMNALQGKAVKNIIDFLSIQVKNKNGESISTEELESNVISAWNYILNNWGKINGFYAEQIKLNQIDSNLPNILMQLKNNQKNKRDDKFISNINELGAVDFD